MGTPGKCTETYKREILRDDERARHRPTELEGKRISTHQKMACLTPQVLNHLDAISLAWQFTEGEGRHDHIELDLRTQTRDATDLTSSLKILLTSRYLIM